MFTCSDITDNARIAYRIATNLFPHTMAFGVVLSLCLSRTAFYRVAQSNWLPHTRLQKKHTNVESFHYQSEQIAVNIHSNSTQSMYFVSLCVFTVVHVNVDNRNGRSRARHPESKVNIVTCKPISPICIEKKEVYCRKTHSMCPR